MSSSDESGSGDIVSERETQFVSRSDDDETLWEVEEITAERDGKYRVKWVGYNPATGKRWPQDWVPKHDCTDLLVAKWKAKKGRLAAGKKRGGRTTSTTSRASGSSKRTGSSSSRGKTRTPMSEAMPSRVDSVGRDPSPPPKRTGMKRRQQSETPATMTSGDANQVDGEGEASRPKKKRRVMLDVLVPPMSSDEEGVAGAVTESGIKIAPRHDLQSKGKGATLGDPDEDGLPPRPKPKGKGKLAPRPDTRSKDAAGSSKSADVPKRPDSKTKAKAVPKHEERVPDTTVISDDSDDEHLRPPNSESKPSPKRESAAQWDDDPPRKRAGPAGPRAPIKVGPPRGVKRQGTSIQIESPRRSGLSPPERMEMDFADEPVAAEEFTGRYSVELLSFDVPSPPPSMQVNIVTSAPSPPRISIPNALPSPRHRSPDLSPGAVARLELFDRMMVDLSHPDVVPPVDPPEGRKAQLDLRLDNSRQLDDAPHHTRDDVDILEPLNPPPSKPKPKHAKFGTSNGLIVPETESSQSQSQSAPKPPSPCSPSAGDQSAHQPMGLPTIAVITASAPSSPASSQDLILPPQRFPTLTNRPLKRPLKPVPRISQNTFHTKIAVPPHTADPEAPPSSIESFTSPKRVDKGKQRAIEDDQVLLEGEGDGSRSGKKITDSELKKRGKKLFDQAQLAREAERQKKKMRRLKSINDIVNGVASSPPKGSPPPFTNETDDALEMRWDEVIDLSGGMNSTTLDTPENGEARPISEEERNRLRIELRQEEEENTQEAMLVYPPPPISIVVDEGGAVQVPVAGSSKQSLPSGEIVDVDHLEQPSTDLQQASIVVQASQEPHEDTDIDPSPSNQLTSSPPRPIPENLTDSPKRRLGEALSLLNVKSEEIQRLERELSEERKRPQGLKAELAAVRRSSEPTTSALATWETERAQWAEERSKWESDSSAWQAQRRTMSEERASLLARVAELSDAAARAEEVGVKLSELEAERVAWTKERDTLLNATTRRPEESAALAQVRGEYGQDWLKWEAEKASWIEERAGWDSERTALQEKQETLLRSLEELTASLESQRSATASAQKDREFFREQYAQASAFVSSVRDENLELEKRTKIAEGQAQEGVATIKAFYEGRFQALQADVARWKGLTELLQEKDQRTNDELRLRAAQVPELVDFCGRLTVEKQSLEAEIWKLGRAQQRGVVQRKDLCHKVLLLQNERKSLRSKLSQRVKMAGSSSQGISQSVPAPPILEYPDNVDQNDTETMPDPTPHFPDRSFDEPVLFPCMWRPQWRDQCQLVFDSKEDLERHLQDHFRDLLTQ